MNIRSIYKRIAARHPFIGAMIRKLYYRYMTRQVTKRIYGKHNVIVHRNAILSSIVFDIIGEGNKIEIMDGCVLNHVQFYIRGNNHRVLIGNRCKFNGGGNIWIEDNDCLLSIGEQSTFEDVNLALTEPGSKIEIGRECMFAYDIDVRTGDSHSIISQETNERINYAKDVSIDDHVWIAAHSILLKGTAIAENSIVATGSVVTRRFFAKGIIIGGNPAKQIGEGITWVRKRIYKSI